MTFTEMISGKLAELRKEAGLVDIKLKGVSQEQLKLIEEKGGRLVRSGYDTWCSSDTCAHNSHDPGENWDVVAVPETWVSEAEGALQSSVWDLSEEDGSFPKFLIPSDPPVLLVQEELRYSAGQCVLAGLKEEAVALLPL